jgi:uncharacterized membrane protein
VSYREARAVIERQCLSGHSEHPTNPAFPIAPKIELDTADQMKRAAESMRARTVVDKTMPLLNRSGMTDDEREILRRWIDSGASGP